MLFLHWSNLLILIDFWRLGSNDILIRGIVTEFLRFNQRRLKNLSKAIPVSVAEKWNRPLLMTLSQLLSNSHSEFLKIINEVDNIHRCVVREIRRLIGKWIKNEHANGLWLFFAQVLKLPRNPHFKKNSKCSIISCKILMSNYQKIIMFTSDS